MADQGESDSPSRTEGSVAGTAGHTPKNERGHDDDQSSSNDVLLVRVSEEEEEEEERAGQEAKPKAE